MQEQTTQLQPAAGPRLFFLRGRHPATSTGPARQRQQQQPACSGVTRWAHPPAAVLLRWRQDPRLRLPGTALTTELRTDALEAIPRLSIGAVTPGATGGGGDALLREVGNAAVTAVCALFGPDTFTNHALVGRGTAASVQLGVHAGAQAEASAGALLRTPSIAVPFRDTVLQVPVDSLLVPRQPHTHKLVICGLPGRFALEGVTAQLLHCAGLPISADGSDPSAAAVAGELLGDQQGRRGTGGCPLPDAAHLVAFVHAPTSDPQLLGLPRSFCLDQQTVRIRVFDLAEAPPEVEGGGPFTAGPTHPSLGAAGEMGPGLLPAPLPRAEEPMLVDNLPGALQAQRTQPQGPGSPAPTAPPGPESPAAAPAAAGVGPPTPALPVARELPNTIAGQTVTPAQPAGRHEPAPPGRPPEPPPLAFRGLARLWDEQLQGPTRPPPPAVQGNQQQATAQSSGVQGNMQGGLPPSRAMIGGMWSARGADPMLLGDPDGPMPSREQLQELPRAHQQPAGCRPGTLAHQCGGRLPSPDAEDERGLDNTPADGPAPSLPQPAGRLTLPVTAPRARASSGSVADQGPTHIQAPAVGPPSPDPRARRFQHLVSAAPRDLQGPDVSDIWARFRATRAAATLPARSPLGSADQASSWRTGEHGSSRLDQVLQTVTQDYARSTSSHRRAGVGSPAPHPRQPPGLPPDSPSRQQPQPPQATLVLPVATTLAPSPPPPPTTTAASTAVPTSSTMTRSGQRLASPPSRPSQQGGVPAAGPLPRRPHGSSTPTPSAGQEPSAGPLPPRALAALQAVLIAAPALTDWQPPPLPVAVGYVDALTDYLANSPHRLASSSLGRYQVMHLFVERHPHLPSPEDVDPMLVVASFCRNLLAQFDSLQPGPLSDLQLDRLLTPAQRRSPSWRGEQQPDPALEAIVRCLNSQSHQLAQHAAAHRTLRDLFHHHCKHLPPPSTLSIDRARHAHSFCMAVLSQVDTRLGLPDSRSARPTRRPARGVDQ